MRENDNGSELVNCPVCGEDAIRHVDENEKAHVHCNECGFNSDVDANLENDPRMHPGEEEPFDGFRSDAEADADALASAGMGTDEDYEHNLYDEQDFGGE